MSRRLFTIEQQPCQDFKPQQNHGIRGPFDNVHECFGPYGEERAAEPRCGSKVSFCQNCNRDHHEYGWQSCGLTVVDQLHLLAAEIRKSGVDVSIEGGGAAIPFLQIVLPDGRFAIFGDAGEFWGGEIYDSLDALEVGDYLESLSTGLPSSNKSTAEISAAFRATFLKEQA